MKKIFLFISLFFLFIWTAFWDYLHMSISLEEISVWDKFYLHLDYSWNDSFDFFWEFWEVKWIENFDVFGQESFRASKKTWWKIEFFQTATFTLLWKSKWVFEIWPAKYTLKNWEEIYSETIILNVKEPNSYEKDQKDTINFLTQDSDSTLENDEINEKNNKKDIDDFKNLLWWFFALITLFWFVWPILLLLDHYYKNKNTDYSENKEDNKDEKNIEINAQKYDKIDNLNIDLSLPKSENPNFLNDSSTFMKWIISKMIWENLKNIWEESILLIVRKSDKIDNNKAILIIEILEKITLFKYSKNQKTKENLKALENIIYDLYNLNKKDDS